MPIPPPRRWSKNQLRRLGNSIRDSVDPPANGPSYDEVLIWYLELAAFVTSYLEECDWTSLLVDRPPRISSRVKTIDTLRAKLRAKKTFPLHAIHDIAGVRFEADMSLVEQDAVVEAIRGYFNDMGVGTDFNDYRTSGGHSGYRAVHIMLDLSGRVEIQVRTHLQGQWANMYEALADVIGRFIRYDQFPIDAGQRSRVEHLQRYSHSHVRRLEELRVTLEGLAAQPGADFIHLPNGSTIDDLRQEYRELEEDALSMLREVESDLRQMRQDVP